MFVENVIIRLILPAPLTKWWLKDHVVAYVLIKNM